MYSNVQGDVVSLMSMVPLVSIGVATKATCTSVLHVHVCDVTMVVITAYYVCQPTRSIKFIPGQRVDLVEGFVY